MKLLVISLLVALATCAVLDPFRSLVKREVEAVAEQGGELRHYQLPDGRVKLELVVDGVFAGSIVQTADGGGKRMIQFLSGFVFVAIWHILSSLPKYMNCC